MGRWGEHFFEGDNDLDVASYISEDAGIELYNYEIGTNPEYELGGKGLEATREHLNNGVFNHLFKQYATQDKFHGGIETKELSLVFLAALAMRLGTIIELEFMDLLRSIYTKIPVSPKYSNVLCDSGFRRPMKRQFEIALAHYKNDGTPYNFYAPRCELAGCDKAEDELPEGQKLLQCAKCRQTFYCGKECQKTHWKAHKKICKTPEERREAEKKMFSGRNFTLLNV